MIFYLDNNIDEQCSDISDEINNCINLQTSKLNTISPLLLSVCSNAISESIENFYGIDNLFKDIKSISDMLKKIIKSLQDLSSIITTIQCKVKDDDFTITEELKETIINYNKLAKGIKKKLITCDDKYFNFINKFFLFLSSSGESSTKDTCLNDVLKLLSNDSKAILGDGTTQKTNSVDNKISYNDSEENALSSKNENSASNIHLESKNLKSEHKAKRNTNSGSTGVQDNSVTPELKDNRVLLISEKNKKVYLPYHVSDLEKALKNNSKYASIQDVINAEYVVPLSRYTLAIQSRFRETYNLMRKKEHASIYESLDISFELAFKNLLNPAIITACKNLDELDIYLDCLDSNELDKFDFFTVKYDFAPSKV